MTQSGVLYPVQEALDGKSMARNRCMCGALGDNVSAQARQNPFHKGDPGVVDPVVAKEVHPRYTRQALEARIEGTIEMDAVCARRRVGRRRHHHEVAG
jgi:hypothetical protein